MARRRSGKRVGPREITAPPTPDYVIAELRYDSGVVISSDKRFVAPAAALAPGSMTPVTGMERPVLSFGTAKAEAVLQAATSILMSYLRRKAAISKEYLSIVSFDLLP